MKRMEIRCNCGAIGRLIYTNRIDAEGKEVCNFVCTCDNPQVNFADPYIHD